MNTERHCVISSPIPAKFVEMPFLRKRFYSTAIVAFETLFDVILARIVLIGLACFACSFGRMSAQALDGLLRTKKAAVDVTIAFSEPGSVSPSAVVKISRLWVEREKRGIFRVALLPKVILQNVAFELRSSTALCQCQREMGASLRRDRFKRAIEIRGITFNFPQPGSWILQAACAVPLSNAVWELKEVSLKRDGENTLTLLAALLISDGSGRTFLRDSNGHWPDVDLFSPSSVTSRSSPSTPGPSQ